MFRSKRDKLQRHHRFVLKQQALWLFIDGPFIPQDTQSKKSEYIESA